MKDKASSKAFSTKSITKKLLKQNHPIDSHINSESIFGYTTKTECIEIGDTVVYVHDDCPDSERQVMITFDSSNLDWSTINFRAPIAQALLGASPGDRVEAKLPIGLKILHIKQIR